MYPILCLLLVRGSKLFSQVLVKGHENVITVDMCALKVPYLLLLGKVVKGKREKKVLRGEKQEKVRRGT